MYSSLDSLETDVFNKIEQGDFSAALDLIIHFVKYVTSDPDATAVVFGSERLDRLCLVIGKAVAENTIPSLEYTKKEKYSEHVVTIASHLDRYGGHTLVVEDIIRAQPDKIHIILLTNLFNMADVDSLAERLSGLAEFRVAPQASPLDKMEWLLAQLEVIKPDRIVLFNHHEDAIVIASMQPWLGSSKIIFYHHADHALCLGVHLPKTIHVDPHNIGYENCRTQEGLKDNRYLPLVVRDRGNRPIDLGFMQDGILRTCSSGTSYKFFQPYPYLYAELIPEMLALRGGIHFHIGNLSDSQIDSIFSRLIARGIDTRCFIHIPWVPSLWSALIENKIDLYISSFPLGGGRATIEAMGSGTPLLMHESYFSRFHGGLDLAYSEAFVWRTPIEFYAHIGSIDLKTLGKHSKQARQHYEANHLPQIMALELNHICSGESSLAPLPLRSYIPDELQKYLHVNANETSLLEKTLTEPDEKISNLYQAVAERDNRIANLNQAQFELNTRITVLENSTSWKITFPLRRALTSTPALKKFCRRTAQLAWWAGTFQLGNRLREWARDIERIETPHFAPPTDDYCLAVPLDYSVDKWESAPRIAVICHMFYTEMADEFQRYFINIPFPFDLFITTDSQEKRSTIESHFSQWNRGKIEIWIAANRGRDIAPKLIACRDIYDKYEFVLHIHTKKSPHDEAMMGWRFYLLETLIGSKQIVESIFESFRSDRKLGMIAPQHFAPVHHSIGWGWNFENAKAFARRIGVRIPPDGRLDFPSGSMFWARSVALKPLLDCNLSLDEFQSEEDQIDGTLGHVIERLYFFVCERAGYRWIKISQSSSLQQAERIKHVKNQKELLSFIKNTQYELLKPRILQFLSSLLRKSRGDASWQPRKMDRLVYEKSGYTNMDFSQFQHELALHIEKKESRIDFDENFYLHANRDVIAAVAKGDFSCGFVHYCLVGQAEERVWSNYKLKQVFGISPSFPDGFNAPVHIRPLPRYSSTLDCLPKSPEPFLLIFFSHLQDDLFFAGYTEFFRDFGPIFGRFSKIILSVENEKFNRRLATRYSDRIEVIQEKELIRLKYRPDLVLTFNSQLSIRAKQICNDPNRAIYYCQDFESGFFPYGAEYVEAEKAITSSRNIIVSTNLLRNFLVDKQLLNNQRVFTTSPKIESFDVPREKTKRLFFYFRPEFFHRRNLPQTLMEVVQDFCEKHSGYEIYMVGSVDTRYSYKINGTPVYVISKLPKKDYIQLISSCDVVVSLIYSAHPGVIAFQAAASGIPTVTNIFENRNAVLLKQISENILPYDPVRENLLELVEEALTMPKGKKSFNEALYSGPETESLDEFIDTILSSERVASSGKPAS